MGAQKAALNVSRETNVKLEEFASLIRKWNPAVNLVSRSSLDELWDRHILDSAQLYALRPENVLHWADLGSGGGLPGLVIAILAAESARDLRVSLVESDARKAAFLAEAARRLGLDVEVHVHRIETLPPLNADFVSARALAPLPVLLTYARRHLKKGGTALFPKGASAEAEIADARLAFRFNLTHHPSTTDGRAAILEIGEIEDAASA